MKLSRKLFGSMLVMIVAIALGSLIWWGRQPAPQSSASTGFDVFAQQSGFQAVTPDYHPEYPKDMAAHPGFATEWWYLTATLEDSQGQTYGVQWTLFRRAIRAEQALGWSSPQLYMAHVAITRADQQWEAERFARGGIGQAGVTLSPFQAWLDDWQWQGQSDPFPATVEAQFEAQNTKVGFALQVEDSGLRVKQGEQGYSIRHESAPSASYYFSVPQLRITGSLTLDGKSFSVTGKGWFDKEWSSGAMADDQSGWDWFGLNLDDGRALMVTQIRGPKPFVFGSLTSADGKVRSLDKHAIRMVPVNHATLSDKRTLPVGWQIRVPDEGINVTTQPLNPDSWMALSIPYWEGPVRVEGSVSGRGFMEATGY
ncbi:lipocalin-like domain-containing protein [Salinivibrio sp. IB872]|uniref:lipocalin-like domain-containing protein n=1 Tax=Salinivibrio sp. IB872 TaxID=1766123 RepID=UPI000984E124|nr:lipocalin-like domain-containing protein [Salinivibrio sp. IB872]OOF25298.1 hypothetical protein BZJ18_12070 [Salinivibrio sp. IB872]